MVAAMGFNAMRRPRVRARGSLVAALDLGTTKVVCFVARIGDGGQPQVIGIGHQASRGVRAGTIVELDSAEKVVGLAVQAAEQMAGETVHEVVVNLSGGHPASQSLSVEVPVTGREIGDADLRRASRAYAHGLMGDIEIVHAIPVGYTLDGSRGIRDPRGMFGDQLGIDLHLVTAGTGAIRNLGTCINRAHLEVDTVVLSPFASGLACLVDDETELGCALIDMGGGTTSIAVFIEGRLVFADCIPVGGAHVTNDIARGLTTPVVHAERLKTLYGSALPTVADDREIIDVPQVGEDEPAHPAQVPKSLLTGIIQPRMEEVFELVRGRLEAGGFDKAFGRRVVLTGGASQLQGARELAQLVLDKQVRMGRPLGVHGLAEATAGPAFATATGLLAYAAGVQTDLAALGGGLEEVASSTTLLGRLGGWFRENL
jgi:cell division protein FtsA